MLIGRILQGVSAAVVWTVGLALMADTVRPTEIGQMVAFVSLSLTLAELIAPLNINPSRRVRCRSHSDPHRHGISYIRS